MSLTNEQRTDTAVFFFLKGTFETFVSRSDLKADTGADEGGLSPVSCQCQG